MWLPLRSFRTSRHLPFVQPAAPADDLPGVLQKTPAARVVADCPSRRRERRGAPSCITAGAESRCNAEACQMGAQLRQVEETHSVIARRQRRLDVHRPIINEDRLFRANARDGEYSPIDVF